METDKRKLLAFRNWVVGCTPCGCPITAAYRMATDFTDIKDIICLYPFYHGLCVPHVKPVIFSQLCKKPSNLTFTPNREMIHDVESHRSVSCTKIICHKYPILFSNSHLFHTFAVDKPAHWVGRVKTSMDNVRIASR